MFAIMAAQRDILRYNPHAVIEGMAIFRVFRSESRHLTRSPIALHLEENVQIISRYVS